MRNIGRRSLIVGTAGLLAAPAIVRAQGANGVALVVGNSKFQWEAQLPNVKRDVPDVAKTFQAMGLKTELIQDAGKSAMQEAIAKFDAAARGADFAAFYFAGHGTQWNKDTYLVPVDADLSLPKTDGLVPTSLVRNAVTRARASLSVYDNCRNNPADGWRQKQAEDASLIRGIDQESFAKNNPNSVVLYSTAPGRVALDGPPGQNSPFAAALLRELNGDSVKLSTLAGKVRRDVMLATRGQQVVVDYNFLDRPVSLQGARLARPAASGDTPSIIELTKAYGFATQNKILLPQGLVAFRSGSNSQLQQKVGSFKYTEITNTAIECIMVVFAADTEGATQIVLAGPQNKGWWRFITGKIAGDELEYRAYDSPNAPHKNFRWRDANSGRVIATYPGSTTAGGAMPKHSTFERLDG